MSTSDPRAVRVRSPERITAWHDVSAFDNGNHASLDAWLKDRALASKGLSARTYGSTHE